MNIAEITNLCILLLNKKDYPLHFFWTKKAIESFGMPLCSFVEIRSGLYFFKQDKDQLFKYCMAKGFL